VDTKISLPHEFCAALEEDFQKQLRSLESQSSGQISEMIDRCREEATEQIEKLRAGYQVKRKRLMSARARALRAVESAGEKKYEDIRLARLEQRVREQVELFRRSPEYRDFLARMFDQCRSAGFSGCGVIQCEEPEAELLGTEFQGCRVVRKELGRWGGFILKGEGGTLFDCTFHTRWRQYIRRISR
jgi:hypothetical protein